MSPSLGDFAESVATKLTMDSSAPVAEATTIAEDAALQADNNLFTKIRFTWRPEDRAMRERIHVAAEAMFQEAMTEPIRLIDDFFMQLRVPEQHEVDGQMIVTRGLDDRPVWKKDEHGHVIERWDQLTGQDIEYTLASLHRVRMMLAPQANELFLDALYARHVASDIYDDTWGSMMDGTQGDRSARANRESRPDRYAAYFRFYLYSVADTFLKEVSAFMKTLENIRYWQVRTQKG